MKTITIEVPDKTRYFTGAIIVNYGEESKPIYFNFDANTISGAKINESGEVAYMIRLEHSTPLPNNQVAWEQGFEAGLAQGKHESEANNG